MDLEPLFVLQQQYLSSRDQTYLAELYNQLVKLSIIVIKSKFQCSNISDTAHEASTLLIERYLKEPTFQVRESWLSFLYNNIRHLLYNKKKIRQDNYLDIQDISIQTEQLTFDYYVDPLTILLRDHPKGKWLLYRLYKNPTVTATIKEALNNGFTKRWIRDHAKELFTVKRTLRCKRKKG